MKLLAALSAAALLPIFGASAMAQTPQASAAAPAPPPLAVQSIPGGGERMPATPEVRAARQAVRASCAADMSSLCADAQPAATAGERGGRMQCLRIHAAQLSVPCRQALVAMRDARKAAKS